MVSEKDHREIPWCTVLLVVGAVFFQSVTLAGNMKMAAALTNIGGSVDGWSLVGLGLSSSLQKELNTEVEKVQTDLTAAITKISHAQSQFDQLLSLFGVKVAHAANKTVALLMEQEELDANPHGSVMGGITGAISDIPKLQHVNVLLLNFLSSITPALDVIGAWILKFGPKIETYVSQMGTTIDRAQKNFDKMMAHMMSSTGEDIMMFESFNLYDMQHTGAITLFDIHEVGSAYGINAYQGAAGTKLFKKYAGNNSQIDKGHEFQAFVRDKSAPYAMSILLRSYAKKMAQVAGLTSTAAKRIDMSYAISEYLQLTCARNLTRVEWVTQMLTNGTLPEAFTATVLIQLALARGNPNSLTTVNIGQMSVGAMVTNNITAVLTAMDLLAHSSFFKVEGFNVNDQPTVVRTLSTWIITGPDMWKKMVSVVGFSGGTKLSNLEVSDSKSKISISLDKVFSEMPGVAERLASERMRAHHQDEAVKKIEERKENYQSETEQLLLLHLTGGRSFTAAPHVQSAASRVVHGGVPCAPITLEWAQWLAANATSIANSLQHYSYNYAKTSSTTTDSFNTQVQAITKKVNSFVHVMITYSTPEGIADLKAKILAFQKYALNDVMKVVEKTVLKVVKNSMGKMLGNVSTSKASLLELAAAHNRSGVKTRAGSQERAHQILAHIAAESERRQAEKVGEEAELAMVWSEVQTVFAEVMNLMPSAVNTIATAKADVQQVYKTLDSTFTVLQGKGPTIFNDAAYLYKVIWTLYWFFLVPFTLVILFYSFWVNGWCGGPKVDKEEHPAPETCSDYISCVCRACCACMSSCGTDSALCFWSYIIFMQVLSLVLFLMSILFTIIGGIEIFLDAGCSQVYVINDGHICQTSMGTMQSFLKTFYVGNATGLNPMASTCNNNNLLLCQKMSTHMQKSAMYTVIGSFTACIFTFQLIFDSAINHERARWRKMMLELENGTGEKHG